MTGDRMLRVARGWFADDIVARVFEPLVADWQREHQVLRGLARARSMLRGWTCFAITAAMMMPWQLKQRLPERVTLSGWIATELFVAIGVVAQWYLVFDANPRGVRHLLPASLGIALPLALIPAAFVVWRVGTPVEARTMMLRLMLLSMLTLGPLLAWWLPYANQQWRVTQAGDTVQRGSRELTAPELLRSQAPADLTVHYASGWNIFRRNALLERASILFMPLTMSVLGLAVAALTTRHWALVGVMSWVFAGGLWLTALDVTPWGAHALLLDAALLVRIYDKRSTAIAR